jgi:hypothetical protein
MGERSHSDSLPARIRREKEQHAQARLGGGGVPAPALEAARVGGEVRATERDTQTHPRSML